MKVHGNAALGPARRLALVQAIEAGDDVEGGTCRPWRGAGHSPRLVAPLADGGGGGEAARQLPQGPLLAPAPPATAAHRRRRGADPARPPRDRPGSRPPGRHLPPLALDDLEGPAPSRPFAAARQRQGELRPLRVVAAGLLHVDVARLARFNRPGHPVTGVRDKTWAEERDGVGYVYLHCVIDDCSRYGYVEQHPDQGGATAAAVLERAIEHFVRLGMKPPEAVMSDNAFAYRRSNAFRPVLERYRAATSSPRPTRPAGTARSRGSSKP